MSNTKCLLPILKYGAILLVIDMIYLHLISGYFGQMIRKIQGAPMRVKMLPAAIDYLLIIGAWFFFIYQDRAKHSEKETIMRAALLGFFIYGIFDMTNLAIIEKYQWDLAIIDSIWGGVLFAVSTAFFFRF